MREAPRIAFVLEQTLGHVTHSANLQTLVGADDRIDAAFAPIEFAREAAAARVPGMGNWTIRAGLRARRAVRSLRREGPLDAMFVHTQVPAILMPDRLARIPTVVSLDATPIQYDELGAHYGHDTGSSRVEHLKWRANRACFARAVRIVTWAEWTKRGLVDRYEVPADKIVVIPPGVHYDAWASVAPGGRGAGGPVRVLFVGGDLERKGGLLLVEAIRRLRDEGLDVQLDLVTAGDPGAAAGVTVHHGLRPNSPELIALYQAADVFCLPTFGDCLPMVLSEAGAVGLPLIASNVGAISEIVRDESTGLLVPVGDIDALEAALRRLVLEPELRHKLGTAAQETVRQDFDAKRNALRLVDLLLELAGRTDR
jgi:glycosyltransferase involved in cell wall biosynthesis